MDENLTIKPIAHIISDFEEKFGIPRQSGLAPSGISVIVFEPEYRDENALRGLDGYSHLWLIWAFSAFKKPEGFSPMVKPPRLGGKKRMGVFATRSPNRPNPLGLSSVRIVSVEKRPKLGTVIVISGADLMNGTPIYDIKPYLPYTDSHPDAADGFAGEALGYRLEVVFPEELLALFPPEKRAPLLEALSLDPRPAYIEDPGLPYGFKYAGLDVRFRADDTRLTVFDVLHTQL